MSAKSRHLPVLAYLLVERVRSRVLGVVIVVVDWMISICSCGNCLSHTGLLQCSCITSNLLGELFTTKLLHQPSTDIVLAVPFNLLSRGTVEYQSNWELFCQLTSRSPRFETHLVVLPHFVGDEIAVF
jgi:hypothetical protein